MTAPSIEIGGSVDPAFQAVADAFAANFEAGVETGASVCVTVAGRTVVDLWGGWADQARTRPWERDTLVNVWSSTKGIAATTAHVLAGQGRLDFEAPVARYWPEFAQAGKADLPVKYILSHQSGLVDIEGEKTPGISRDWDAICAALAATHPQWQPGTANGYHAVTYGWLVGEVVRRVSGAASFGAYLREAVTGPLGADFWVGLPVSEHHRIAEIHREETPAPTAGGTPVAPPAPDSPRARAMLLAGPAYAGAPNSPEWREAEMPGINGHGNARSLARVYTALANGGEVDGVRLMSAADVERAAALQVASQDLVIAGLTRRTLGFMLPFAELGDVRPATAFGHGGAGGSQGFADPASRVAFGYAMNRMSSAGGVSGAMDPRGQRLAKAVYDSL
ncbi:MAG: serine hydrolase domain-containing protein [Dehalococcoidia bacterium]|nr:serine hydrolase domain-containing protein [Dehalococcoidia bacterium]